MGVVAQGADQSASAIVLNEKDNVATAIKNCAAGEVLVMYNSGPAVFKLTDRVELGHKFALRDIHRGEDIYKYGEVIGRASEDISQGKHVHVHNVVSLRGRGDLEGEVICKCNS